MSKFEAKVTFLKLDTRQETKSGKTYRAHILKVEDADGDEHKYKVSTKAKPAKFIADLKKGQDITVQEEKTDWGKQLVAVYSKRSQKQAGYDPTGAIQGLVLKAAVDSALASAPEKLDVDVVVEAAKLILKAKSKIDKLVAKAVGKKDDSDDEEDTDNEDDDVEENEAEDEEDDKESEEEDEESDGEEDEESEDKKAKKKRKASKSPF